MKQGNSTTRNLRARLTLIFILLQLAWLGIAYFVAVSATSTLKLAKDWQLPIGFVVYSILTIVTVVSIIYVCLRTLFQVENYFDSLDKGSVFSPENISSRSASQIIKTISGQIPLTDKIAKTGKADTHGLNGDYILNHLPTGIVVLDASSQPILANDTLYSFLGATKGSLAEVSQKLAQIHFTHQMDLVKWIAMCQKDKIHDQIVWNRVDLKLVEDEETVTKMFDIVGFYNKGEPNGMEILLAFVDRTKDYAEDDTAMDFIAIAAHELRGPITVMRGLIDIFNTELNSKLDADQKELLRKMDVSSKQLANYISNILNVAHIDRDSFETTLRREKWQPLIGQIIQDMKDQAEARGRHLSVDIPDDLPDVAVDRVGIEHVMINLIDNAIKYSKDDGTIYISSKLSEGTVETTVKDDGIGIPESVMGHLFTKFYRSHRSKKAISGSGIGLYLCKIIIDAHGGDIWVRSQEDKGTSVGFTVPVYDKVADRVKSSDNDNGITRGSHGWIKNHSLYRR